MVLKTEEVSAKLVLNHLTYFNFNIIKYYWHITSITFWENQMQDLKTDVFSWKRKTERKKRETETNKERGTGRKKGQREESF